MGSVVFLCATAQPSRIQPRWPVPATARALGHQRDSQGAFVFPVNPSTEYHYKTLTMKLLVYRIFTPYQEKQLVGTAAAIMTHLLYSLINLLAFQMD